MGEVTNTMQNEGSGSGSGYSCVKTAHVKISASVVVKDKISDANAEKLDMTNMTSVSKRFCLADLGCSFRPNALKSMQNIVEAIEKKYKFQCPTSPMPKFQVFFNVLRSNDFNNLFTSLPLERPFFVAGVPGSFYGRLFPDSYLHFVHAQNVVQCLSRVPKEALDDNSPAWNKGRIHYTNAPDEVANAYAAQFAEDMEIFLNARAKELVIGGIMVLIITAVPNGIPHSRAPVGIVFDLLMSSLMEMTKKGTISEAQVDSFNLPIYAPSLNEVRKLVERNQCFSVETIELTNQQTRFDGPIDRGAQMKHVRSRLEGLVSKHFGDEIIDELFDRFYKKIQEFSKELQSISKEETQLFIVLKRK